MNVPTVDHLVRDIRRLLEEHEVRNWTAYFQQMERQLEAARVKRLDWQRHELVEELQLLFGGMGSFNDYAITSMHGDRVSKVEEARVNDELNQLRHQLAVAVQQELNMTG